MRLELEGLVVFRLEVVFWLVDEPACSCAMLGAVISASNPLKLRLLYRLAGSTPPERITCVSSALFARLCPGLIGGDSSETAEIPFGVGCDVVMYEVPAVVERCVGVVPPVGTLFDESVRPAPRRYRPGEGFVGASPAIENERSGIEVERVIEGATLSMGFLRSLSSFTPMVAPPDERLEEPEVETVESEEDEGWEGCPSRDWVVVWLGGCCRA